MTHFADEAPNDYHPKYRDRGLVSAGWLESGRPFCRGLVEKALVHRLASIVAGSDETELGRFERLLGRSFGRHRCSFCPRSLGYEGAWNLVVDGTSNLLGSLVLEIPAADRVYAVPDLILHYVLDHRYRPPAPLLDALRSHRESLEGRIWHLEWVLAERIHLRCNLDDYPDLLAVTSHEVRELVRDGRTRDAIALHRDVHRADLAQASRRIKELEDAQADAARTRRRDILVRHGGVSENCCAWIECEARALRGMALCLDHAYPETHID